MYLKHQSHRQKSTGATTNTSTTATDTIDNSITATWLEGKGFIPVPDSVLSIVKVFDFTDKANLNHVRCSLSVKTK